MTPSEFVRPLKKFRPSGKPKTTKQAAAPSFAKALFHGQVLSDTLFPFPKGRPDEQEILQMTVDALQKLARDIAVEQIEEEKRIPSEVLGKLREMGLFGLIIPEEYGGFGVSNYTYVQIMSTVALIDSSITVTLGAHQSIG